MPVSVATTNDPFRGQVTRLTPGLRVPQARVLAALMPNDPSDPPSEWPLLTRTALQRAGGYSPTNSLNRLLNGVPGKSPGLIQLGLIEPVSVNVDGLAETSYRITAKGVQCLSRQNGAAALK